jgi:hypothetical protein
MEITVLHEVTIKVVTTASAHPRVETGCYTNRM